MTAPHEPTPEFRNGLEDTVLSAMRHHGNVEPTIPPPGTLPIDAGRAMLTVPRHRLRTAALVAAALAIGALAGAAPAQVQDVQNRTQLLAAAEADEQLALIRLQLARAALDEAHSRFALGALGRESLAAAEAEVRTMESNVMRIRLDQEEIRATAAPPRREISAPLAGSRDFVTERLHLDLAAAQRQLVAAEQSAAEVERRYDVGATSRLAILDAQLDVARARGALQLLGIKADLRQQFLRDALSVADVERELQRQNLLVEADLAQRVHSLAAARLANLRELNALGQAEQLEVMRAEVEVLERAHELQRIARRLNALNAAPDRQEQSDSGGSM